MRTVRTIGDKRVEVIELPQPEPRDDFVVVKVMSSSICGSEKRGYYAAGPSESNGGHEAAGMVWQTDRPRFVKDGDRVSIYTTRQHCGRCRECLRGNWVLCESNEPGPMRHPGTHSQYMLLRDDYCLPLPDDISFETGALLSDALGTPFRAIKRLGVGGRDTVLVLGAGPLGLASTLLCRFSGATVIVSDINAYRLGCAERCGANVTLNPTDDDVQARVRETAGKRGVDVAIDASGSEAGRLACIEAIRPGGRVAFLGLGGGFTLTPEQANAMVLKETQLIGSWYSTPSDQAELTDLVRRGLEPERMVSHRFGIEAAPAAFETFFGGSGAKVMIEPWS